MSWVLPCPCARAETRQEAAAPGGLAEPGSLGQRGVLRGLLHAVAHNMPRLPGEPPSPNCRVDPPPQQPVCLRGSRAQLSFTGGDGLCHPSRPGTDYVILHGRQGTAILGGGALQAPRMGVCTPLWGNSGLMQTHIIVVLRSTGGGSWLNTQEHLTHFSTAGTRTLRFLRAVVPVLP